MQDRGSHLVNGRTLLVLPAVEFHDEPGFQADEIGDEPVNRVLAAKLEAREPAAP